MVRIVDGTDCRARPRFGGLADDAPQSAQGELDAAGRGACGSSTRCSSIAVGVPPIYSEVRQLGHEAAVRDRATRGRAVRVRRIPVAQALPVAARHLASPRKFARSFSRWLAIAVTGGVFLFLTKTGPEISRGWALDLDGGRLPRARAPRAPRCASRCVRYAVAGATCGTSSSSALARTAARSRRRLKAAPWSGLNVRGFYDDDAELARQRCRRHAGSGQDRPHRRRSRAGRPRGPGVDRAAAARGEPHSRSPDRNAANDLGRALRPGHLQLSSAASFGIGGRRIAGPHPDRFAAHGCQLDAEGARGFRSGVDSSSDQPSVLDPDRDRRQAVVAGPGVLPPGARDVERPTVPNAQVPLDAARRRDIVGAGLVAPGRSASDADSARFCGATAWTSCRSSSTC